MRGGRSGRAGHDVDRVTDWPQYLLNGVPPEHRQWISEQAAELDMSVADVIRRVLCRRYRMRCPQVSIEYQPEKDRQATSVVLRLQPHLARALDREVARSGHAKRRIILDAIKNSYERSSK